MKTLLATIATVFVGLVALPEKAEARPHHGHVGQSYTYVSGHSSCGCAVYKRRVVTGYDCYHRPIYRYYSVPVVHRCRSHHSSRYYRHDVPRGHYDRSHYRRNSHSGHRGVVISGRHGSVRICR
ncbi:hypothetical protein NT6N_25150 [Oceaniferula spumae]|uniref:Uncharacterized protein n=1 Tax=Oceaniferula spumae TaxID=2979115 RepID=A0AAT9FNE5_9BACT